MGRLPAETPKYYFVDEAGDGTLFNKRGRVIIGEEGCSRYFSMGLLDVPNPEALSVKLDNLRSELLADPYFKKVPSMQPAQRKTALAFHAKDDVPEVRREVLKLLHQEKDLRFFAVVKDKQKVLEYVKDRQNHQQGYRYNQNEVYDLLVRRLFVDHLHKAKEYEICFAKRGNTQRTKSLREALQVAQQRSMAKAKITTAALMNVTTKQAAHHCALQAVDYFLWTLQRLYEKREDRYLEYLYPSFRLVIDMDDTREHNYGAYYSQKKPLNVASLPITEV